MLGGTNDSICEETKQPEPTKCNIMIPFKYIPTKKKVEKKNKHLWPIINLYVILINLASQKKSFIRKLLAMYKKTIYQMRWRLNDNGRFDVRSYLEALRGLSDIYFPWKCLMFQATKRVAFFVWTIVWGKNLTCDNLMNRGITLVDWCSMCRCSDETGSLAIILWYCICFVDMFSPCLESYGST